MIIYRDKKTGRFIKKSTWKRSKSFGGKRYVRQSFELEEEEIEEEESEEEEMEEEEEITDESGEEIEEIQGGFDSP